MKILIVAILVVSVMSYISLTTCQTVPAGCNPTIPKPCPVSGPAALPCIQCNLAYCMNLSANAQEKGQCQMDYDAKVAQLAGMTVTN